MPRDSSGNYVLPAGNPVITGTVIASDWANPTMADVGAELQNSLDRQGRGGMSGALRLADGTVSAPGLAWVSDTRSGLLREGLGQWSLVADGQVIMRVSDAAGVFVAAQKLDTATGVFIYEQGQRLYGPANPPPGGGETFLTLNDTPPSYTGFAGQVATVNPTEDGLIFSAAGAGSGDFVGPNGATPDALVLFADASGKLGKESTFTVSEILRTDLANQRTKTDFTAYMDGDASGSVGVERSIGDLAVALVHNQSNALRGHVIAFSGTEAPGGRTLVLQESAQRGVLIGQDQSTPPDQYADAGKDTLRVMGPLYESREGDINYRVHSDLYHPAYPVSNVGGGSHNVTLPDTSFAYQFRTFNDDFAVNSDVFSIADQAVTNAKLTDVNSGTIKLRAQATAGSPEDVRPDGLTLRGVLLDGDSVIVQGVGEVLERTTVADLGKLDTPAHTGTNDARLDMTPSGGDRPLKRILQGTNITVTETADTVTINASLSGTGAGIQKGTPFAIGDLLVVSDDTGDGGANTTNLQAAQTPQLDEANTWTVSPQTFQSGTSDGGIDVAVSQTPRLRLESTSGIADKRDGRVVMTPNGHLDLAGYLDAGSLVSTMAEFWVNGGVVLPPASGGEQGVGSLNAASYYENGTALRTALADTFTVGPAASTNQAIAVFDDLTGKLLANSGTLVSDLATAERGLPPLGTAGQFLIKDSGANYDASWQDPVVRRTYGDYPYQFSADTNTAVDPGSGTLRVNNASASLVTQVAINDADFDTLLPGPDVFAAMAAGDMLFFRSEVAVEGACYRVTGVTDQTGWVQLDVTFVAEATGGLPDGGDRCAVSVELKPSGGGGSGVHNDLTGRDVADTHPASSVTNTPAGGISATDVQAALNGLDTAKADRTSGVTDGNLASLTSDNLADSGIAAAGVASWDGGTAPTSGDILTATVGGDLASVGYQSADVVRNNVAASVVANIGYQATRNLIAEPFDGVLEPVNGNHYVAATPGSYIIGTPANDTYQKVMSIAVPAGVTLDLSAWTEANSQPGGDAYVILISTSGVHIASWVGASA